MIIFLQNKIKIQETVQFVVQKVSLRNGDQANKKYSSYGTIKYNKTRLQITIIQNLINRCKKETKTYYNTL